MAATKEDMCDYFHANYPEVVVKVGEITFGEEQRNLKDRIKEIEAKLRERNNKDKSKKANKDTERAISQLKSEIEKKLKRQVTDLSQAACALLNSGGGVIRAEIENKDYSFKQHRIGLDIEDAFRECIQHKNFSEYFDFKQQESSMSIFVKSWSSENSTYQRVCSLNTGLYERSSSSAVKLKPANAVRFLKRKKDHAKVGSGWQARPTPANVQNLFLQAGVQMEKDINEAAAQFFERDRLDLGEVLDFTESTMVEFKDFPRDKDNYEFARSILPRYASAFANTKGGYLIFGVDNHRKVVGCKRNICSSRFEEVVHDTIGTLPVFHFCASKEEVVFLCTSLPVYGPSENGEEKEYGYVFVVRIEPSCCIVFETTPDSWIMEGGKVKRLTYTEWTLLITEEDPDVSHFAEGFQIELCRAYKPPLSISVYSNKGLTCMKTLQTNLFPVNPDGITCKPEELCEEVFSEYPSLKDLMKKKIEEVSSSLGILIFSRSWAVDVGLQRHPSVACDILLVTADAFPTLYTVTVAKDHSVSSSTILALEYSRKVACALKQKLVNEAGYTQKVCVVPHVIELGADGGIKTDLSWPVTHPLDYLVSRDGLEGLLQALVIALLRFRSFLSDQLGCEFFNLLTVKQYGLLTKNLYKTKKLFIYGLPGSGKTVVALQIIEKIKNIFQCSSGEILYICENRALCKTVRMRVGDMCQAVTRIDFLNGDYTQPVKHIVIDEAQNFQSKDGDWYGKAVSLTEADPDKPGVLWIFLDYLQTSHTEASGLPDPAKQEPQEWLTTGVRNATQVYNVIMHVTEMIANDRPERLQNVVDSICHNSFLSILSPVQVFAVLTERVCNMLNSNITDNSFCDNLKYPQTHVCCGEARAVWNLPDFFENVSICREAILQYPQRTEILYKQLKKLVDEGPQDINPKEILDVAQVCIAMMEFMHEISCFPKRLQLFLEEFKRSVNESLHVEVANEVDPWLELKEESKEESKISFQTLIIPYEQLNRLVEEARCGHSLQGIFDMCAFKDESETVTVIVQKCLEYFAKGYSVKNIAVLCSSVEERDRYKDFLERKMSTHRTDLRMNVCFTTADATEENAIVVDTVHHFSGLERSIVFALFPAAKSSFLVPHLLVCMVSRANLHCHVLLDQSKGFCYITSAVQKQSIQFLNQIVEPGTPGYHYGDCPKNTVHKIMIPADKVELIIGKGEERIKELQILAGVKLVMIPDGPQQTEEAKTLLIMGDLYRVQQVKEMVLHLIHDQDHFREKFNEYRSILGTNFFFLSFPHVQISERVQKMFAKNDASVRILVKPDDGMDPDIIAKTIKLPDRGRYAAEIVFQTSEAGIPGGPGPGNHGRGQGNWNRRFPGRLKEFNYILPFNITKLIIGKDGETLKRIGQQSGARIELQSNLPADKDPNMTVVTIQGKSLQCDYAQQLIEEKMLDLVTVLDNLMPHYAFHGLRWLFSGTPMEPYNRARNIPVPGPPAQGWCDAYIYWQPPNPPELSEPADNNSVPWTVSYTHYLALPSAPPTQTRGQRQRTSPASPQRPYYFKASEEYCRDIIFAMLDRVLIAFQEVLDEMLQGNVTDLERGLISSFTEDNELGGWVRWVDPLVLLTRHACFAILEQTVFKFLVNPDRITCKPEELCEEVFSEYPSLKDLMMEENGGNIIFSENPDLFKRLGC